MKYKNQGSSSAPKVLLMTILSLATAANALADNAYVQMYADRSDTEVSDAKGIVLNLGVDASYCCELRDYGEHQFPSNANHPYPRGSGFTAVRNFRGADMSFTHAGVLSPTLGTSLGPHNSRVCFTTTEFGGAGVAPYFLDIDRDEASSSTKARCEETTLLGGYNTFSSDFLFLEIVAAQTSSPIPVRITVLSSNDRKVFETHLLVKTRSDFSLNAHLGAQPDIGAVVVTSEAPRGAVKAFLAEYRADKSNSRAGLTLVGRQELSPRRD